MSKRDQDRELYKAKASESFGIFLLITIIIVILILTFLGIFLAGFINTP